VLKAVRLVGKFGIKGWDRGTVTALGTCRLQQCVRCWCPGAGAGGGLQGSVRRGRDCPVQDTAGARELRQTHCRTRLNLF